MLSHTGMGSTRLNLCHGRLTTADARQRGKPSHSPEPNACLGVLLSRLRVEAGYCCEAAAGAGRAV
jgi:hypothetical protein